MVNGPPLQGVKSTVRIGPHPVHPMGIPFPITFLVTLPLADLAFVVTSDPFWARVGWWLALLGFASGAGAATVGLIDFATIRRAREQVAGWIHASTNVLALFLAFWNTFLRWDDPVGTVLPWGLLLSAVVAGLIGIAGWYGGELPYRHLIGVTGE